MQILIFLQVLAICGVKSSSSKEQLMLDNGKIFFGLNIGHFISFFAAHGHFLMARFGPFSYYCQIWPFLAHWYTMVAAGGHKFGIIKLF